MRRTGLYILIIGIVLCATVLDRYLVDPATGIRNIIWCVTTMFLVLTVMFTGRMDFGALRSWLVPVFLGYFVMTLVSMTRAINVSESFYGASIVFLSLIFLVAVLLFMDRNKIAKALTILAIVLSLYGFWFLAVCDFGNQVGTMCNRNLWSIALFMLLPFCLYSKWRVGLPAAIMITTNIILLGTRSVLIGLVIFCLVQAVYYKKTLGITLFLAVTILIFARFRTDTRSLNERLMLWSSTVEMIKDHPLGTGAGNWRVMFPWYTAEEMQVGNVNLDRFFMTPHNDYLWMFSELGVAGGVFYLAIFAIAVYYTVKNRNIVILAGLLGIMAIAFFSFPKGRTFLLIMSLMLIAFTIEKGRSLFISRRKICLCGALVIVGLSVVLFGFTERRRMGHHARIIRFARKQHDWSTVAEHTKRMSWFYTLDSTSVPMWFYKGEASFYTSDTAGAALDFIKAYNHNPTYIPNLNNLSTCMAMNGLYDESIICLKRALKVRPDYKPTRHNLSAVYMRMGSEQWH